MSQPVYVMADGSKPGTMVCTRCYYSGSMKKETPGSFLIELILWLFMIIPGVIYSLWRVSNKETICKSCGSNELVKTDSPRGQQILSQLSQSQPNQAVRG